MRRKETDAEKQIGESDETRGKETENDTVKVKSIKEEQEIENEIMKVKMMRQEEKESENKIMKVNAVGQGERHR